MKITDIAVAGTCALVCLGGIVAPVRAQDAVGERSVRADRPAADANLFFYRAHAEPLLWPAVIKVDDRTIVSLGDRRFTAVKVPAGAHKISLTWSFLSGQKKAETELTVVDGQTYYVEVVGVMRVSGFVGSVANYEKESELVSMPAQEGEGTMAACCDYMAPKTADLTQ